MSLLIFRFWTATVLTFLKNGLKLLKDKALEIIPKYGRTEAKVGLKVAERIIIFEALQLILALYFKMMSVVLSGLVLIRIFFEETYICHLYAYLPACFYSRNTLTVRTTNPFWQLLPKEDLPVRDLRKWKNFLNRKIKDLAIS